MPDCRNPVYLASRLGGALRSPLYTNAVYLILAQAAMAGLGFFFWVIVARYYTEAELGYSSAILSTISLVALTGHIGLDSFLVRFLSSADNPRRLFNTCLTYASLATAVAAIIAAAGFPLWSPRLSFVTTQPAFFVTFVLLAVVSTASGIAGSGFVAGRQAKYLLIKDALFSGTKLFLPLLFVRYFHAFGIVASWGIATTVGLLGSLLIFMPRVFPGYRPAPSTGAKLVRRAWGFSGMSYVISLVAAAPKFLMPLVVINLLGPKENAYFYVAWAIATLLYSIPTSLGQSLFAEGSHDRRKLGRDIRRSTLLSILLLVPAILFVWLLGHKVLLAFGGSYSARSIELLRVLSLVALPMTFERIYFTTLRIHGRLRELIVWRLALSVVLLAACYTTIPTGGLMSIGWVYLVTHGVAMLAILVFRRSLWTGG